MIISNQSERVKYYDYNWKINVFKLKLAKRGAVYILQEETATQEVE